MVSSNRQVLACILLFLAVASAAPAQTKDETASISGRVTVRNKGVAGVVVIASEADDRGIRQREPYRATTDDEGNYRINNMPAANYEVNPFAPAFVADKGRSKQRLVVAAGETLRK